MKEFGSLYFNFNRLISYLLVLVSHKIKTNSLCGRVLDYYEKITVVVDILVGLGVVYVGEPLFLANPNFLKTVTVTVSVLCETQIVIHTVRTVSTTRLVLVSSCHGGFGQRL